MFSLDTEYFMTSLRAIIICNARVRDLVSVPPRQLFES